MATKTHNRNKTKRRKAQQANAKRTQAREATREAISDILISRGLIDRRI